MTSILRFLKAPIRWMRKLYDWTVHWSKTPKAPGALFWISFIESSFFPIPPDVLLIAMTISNRHKWIRNAVIATLGSVAGALLGYLIGWGFYETLGKPIVDAYNMHATVDLLGRKYAENAFFVVFTAAFTPIPYKAITITAGLFHINLLTLVIASVIGRAGRFFIVAGALRLFGRRIESVIEKYFDILSVAFILLIAGGFYFLKHTAR